MKKYFFGILFVGLIVNVALAGTKISPDNQFSTIRQKFENERVVVVPIDYFDEELKIGREPIAQALVAALNKASVQIQLTDGDEYTILWEKMEDKIGGFYSAKNGQFDFKRYMQALSGVSKILCKSWEAKYVLIPSFVLRKAEFKGQRARWDGVSIRVPIKGDFVDEDGYRRSFIFTGETQGLSLELMVFDENGGWVATTYGAIGVPNFYRIKSVRDEDQSMHFNSKVFSNKSVKNSVRSALAPLLKEH